MSLAIKGTANHEATAATASTVTYTSTAGSLLVVGCSQNVNNTSTLTVSDSAGNTWTQAGTYSTGATGTHESAMFYVANASAVTSVTCTWSGSISGRVDVTLYEFTGADTSSPLDTTVNSANSGTGTSLTSGTFTTANANDALVYWVSTAGNPGTWTPGAGYSFNTNGNGARGAMQAEIVSSIQTSQTTSMSWVNSLSSDSVFAAFKAASGGGGGPTILYSIPLTGAGQA